MKKNIIALAAAMSATVAMADTSLTMQEQGAEGETTTINIRNGIVAVGENGQITGLYDSASGDFTQLDHVGKGYMVMDDAAMDDVQDQISEAMKEMQAELASMPPEQREMMMKMIPGAANMMKEKETAATAKIDFTGERDKVSGYACNVAKIETADGDVSQACIAKPSAMGVDSDDFAAMGAMIDTMNEFASRFGQDAQFPSAKQLQGIPVRMTSADGEVTIVTAVSTKKLDGAMFEVPAGYTKKSMMDGM
jgi:hypothetical protein